MILLLTYVMVAVAVQAYGGFGETGLGLANPDNVDDVLSVLGQPLLGAFMAGALLLTISICANSRRRAVRR